MMRSTALPGDEPFSSHRPAESLGFVFVQQGRKSRHDRRIPGCEVSRLSRVRVQIREPAAPPLLFGGDIFPSSPAERQVAVSGPENESFMKGLAFGLSEERREEAPAVFGGIVRKRRANQVGKCRKQVAQADEFGGFSTDIAP